MVIVFPPSLVFNAAVVGQTAERGKKAATNQPIGAWRKEREDYTIEKKKRPYSQASRTLFPPFHSAIQKRETETKQKKLRRKTKPTEKVIGNSNKVKKTVYRERD